MRENIPTRKETPVYAMWLVFLSAFPFTAKLTESNTKSCYYLGFLLPFRCVFPIFGQKNTSFLLLLRVTPRQTPFKLIHKLKKPPMKKHTCEDPKTVHPVSCKQKPSIPTICAPSSNDFLGVLQSCKKADFGRVVVVGGGGGGGGGREVPD